MVDFIFPSNSGLRYMKVINYFIFFFKSTILTRCKYCCSNSMLCYLKFVVHYSMMSLGFIWFDTQKAHLIMV